MLNEAAEHASTSHRVFDEVHPLFLRSSSLVLLSLRALLALARQTGVGASLPELLVRTLFTGVIGNLALLHDDLVVDREELVGKLDLALVASPTGLVGSLRVDLALLGRLGLTGEDDQALLVGLEALDVGLEGLFGKVLTAGVDRDTNGRRQLAGNASGLGYRVSLHSTDYRLPTSCSYLQLRDREATTGAHTTVVLDGGAAHDRPELVDGTRGELGGLFGARIPARLLLAGLFGIHVRTMFFSLHCRRQRSQHGGCERGITWSKCTRTRRCQSLRKSEGVVSVRVFWWMVGVK